MSPIKTLLLLCLVSSLGSAETVAISKTYINAPAVDLIYNGQPVDRDTVVDLKKRGVDVSKLDPVENDIWKKSPQSPNNSSQFGFPPANPTMTFDSFDNMKAIPRMFRAVVRDQTGKPFHLLMSIEDEHASLMRANLMRQLGYNIDSPQHYSQITLKFKNLDAKEEFINLLSDRTNSDPKQRWISKNDETKPELTIQDSILQRANIENLDLHWAYIDSPGFIQGERSLRAAFIPMVLLDLSDNVNIYSWEAGTIVSENVLLNLPKSEAFSEITFDDARWAVRKLAKLSRGDWTAIVSDGKYPSDISALLVEKIIARRNHMVQMFDLQAEFQSLPYNPKINVGAVKEGKATQEIYPLYAGRFTWGDPSNPLSKPELLRYMGLEGLSYGLRSGIARLNELLNIRTTSDVGDAYKKDLQKRVIDHFMNNPGKPFSQPLETFGGPLGGFGVSANRSVVTGGYYGSDAQTAQLVDTIGVRANVGYFRGIAGVDKILPGLSANLTASRNYIHVRPIVDMKEALKTSWLKLWVPGFMRNLTGLLETDPEKPEVGLSKFLEELKDGEVLSVVDSLGFGAGAQVTIPISALLGIDPLGYINNAVVGVDGGWVVTRRTMFMKTDGQLQVYVQRLNTENVDAHFDFNFWINIFKVSVGKKWGHAVTKAYMIDPPTEDSKEAKKLAVTLRALLRSNDTEVIESNYNKYLLDHKLENSGSNAKFLRWYWANLIEEHKVAIQPPKDPNHDFNPKDHERILYSYRTVNRNGASDYSLLEAAITALVPGADPSGGRDNDDPANDFLGYSKWKSVTTEAEVTPNRKSEPVTIMEEKWRGWMMPKKSFFGLLDAIEGKVLEANMKMPLIRRDVFNDMSYLYLYDISTTMIVYQKGMQKLDEAIFAKGEKAAVEFLIDLAGRSEHEQRCLWIHQMHRSWPVYHGNEGDYECLVPWIRYVLDLRKAYPTDVEERVRWNNKFFRAMEKKLTFTQLADWLGRDNFYYQIRLAGFRAGEESGTDQGPKEYLSDTIGTFDSNQGAGIFRDFIDKYKFSAYEIFARFFSEGF